VTMLREVDTVKPDAWAVTRDIFDVIQLLGSVLWLSMTENIPADVKVVVRSPSWT